MKFLFNRSLRIFVLASVLAACADRSSVHSPDATKTASDTSQSDELLAKVIYGDDDRLDLYQVQSRPLLALADSTVALVMNSDLSVDGATTRIHTTPYANSYRVPLCSTERFREQDTAAFCSGFLVAPNLVVTAGHCVQTQNTPTSDCTTTRFIFGFHVKSAGSRPLSVPTNEVYSCKQIVKQVLTSNGADFSVVELDRPVTNHKPLKIRREGAPQNNDELVVIGHPSGLPTKVAGGARVRAVLSSYLRASLDTYGGNSGSAVFNAVTNEVEGVLVRGEEDFVVKNGCMESKRCTQNECRGEDVTRISEVATYIPESSPETPEEPTSPTSAEFKATANLTIPDNNSAGVTSSVNVNQAPKGRRVKVEVHISHPWRGDLLLTLVAPDGRAVTLVNRKGRSANDIVGTYGDDLVADGDLSTLSQVSTVGEWKLTASDLAARDVGTLDYWVLKFEN